MNIELEMSVRANFFGALKLSMLAWWALISVKKCLTFLSAIDFDYFNIDLEGSYQKVADNKLNIDWLNDNCSS